MTKKTFLLYILLLFTAMPVSAGKDFYEGEPVYASRWRDYRRSSYFGLRFGLNVPTVRYKGTGGEAQTNLLPRYISVWFTETSWATDALLLGEQIDLHGKGYGNRSHGGSRV